MNELEEAVRLAKELLDVVNCDMDDELRILSRQLLHSRKEVDQLTSTIVLMQDYNTALKAIYALRTRMFLSAVQGVIWDTKVEREFVQASIQLEKVEASLTQFKETAQENHLD